MCTEMWNVHVFAEQKRNWARKAVTPCRLAKSNSFSGLFWPIVVEMSCCAFNVFEPVIDESSSFSEEPKNEAATSLESMWTGYKLSSHFTTSMGNMTWQLINKPESLSPPCSAEARLFGPIWIAFTLESSPAACSSHALMLSSQSPRQ